MWALFSGGLEFPFQKKVTFYRGMGTSLPLNVLPAAAGEFRTAGGFRAASLLRAASPPFFNMFQHVSSFSNFLHFFYFFKLPEKSGSTLDKTTPHSAGKIDCSSKVGN